jgi:hypothetical protein
LDENFSSFFIQNLWDLLNGLSFLSALALISISMPASDISKKLMTQILDFVFMNCFMTDKWLDPLLFHKDFVDEPYNENFNNCGYGSRNAIRNMGSSFIFLMGIISGLVFFPIS